MIDKEQNGDELIDPRENGINAAENPENEAANKPFDTEISDGQESGQKPPIEEGSPASEYSGRAGGKKDLSMLAAVLSSASLLFLCALMLFITVATAMNDQREVIYLQVSGYNPQQSYNDDSEMLEEFMDSVVVITAEKKSGSGGGTGVVISENGYIVTNYHVVQNTTAVYVRLYSGSGSYKATVIGYSEADDIAVIKIEKNGLRPATFVKDSTECRLGERVYAIGAPEGSDYAFTPTSGIISAVNRELKIYDETTKDLDKKMRVIQTDTPVNHGNSGGPLINSRGEVVCIVTIKIESYIQKNGELKVIDGLGFALPSDGVLPLIEAIIETGTADGVKSTISSGRPVIGINSSDVKRGKWYKLADKKLESITAEQAAQDPDNSFNAKEDGICVTSTSAGSGADGKLLPGDVITAINGQRVYTVRQLTACINELHGGDQVEITCYRDGKEQTVTITLLESPIK